MSILFVGPYRQPDEWGKRSFNLLSCIKTLDLNITARPLFLAGLPALQHVEETEYIKFDNYDILIQHALPQYFVADSRFKKNIGVIDLETIDIRYTGWLYKLNLLDEIWISSSRVKEYLEKEFPDKTIRNIPHSLDTSVASNPPKTDPINGLSSDRFKFYFIADANPKNGLEELLIAYYKSFTSQDQVQLVLFLPNVSPSIFEPVFQQCVARAGSLYDQALTPLVHVVNMELNAEQLIATHDQCDCFISPSHSLSTQNLPLQAATFGNTPIVTDGVGTAEVLTDKNAWLIESYDECCALGERPFPDVFTAKETIRKPIINSLSSCLLEAYNNKYIRDKKKVSNEELRQSLSHQTIAEILKDYVCIP